MGNWSLPEPDDDSDRKLLSDLASHGWHIVGVDADEGGPAFAFSVGLLYTLGHPEIMIMGLKHPISGCLINNMGDAIRSGMKFDAGNRYGDIAERFPLAFVAIDKRYYRD
jgi:hypothetical protein